MSYKFKKVYRIKLSVKHMGVSWKHFGNLEIIIMILYASAYDDDDDVFSKKCK